ncbi:leucine--tRNA ligase [Buchnera aphidicola]|uniref:leucine--tRNA ligase n=1 Tax=Buchnera aphidicola TaxID=9 RepID=UPI003464894F
MEKIYNPKIIEPIVQKYWDNQKTFEVSENKNKKKYYCLAMLPYPSGKLHMGHVRNYTISDVIARYQRMLGKNVLHPIGWDAFGLPAEEAAIKNNIIPSKWTYNNINYMKKQLKNLGFSYDWNREITTCNPEYYKWEQWFFNKLYLNKLIYRSKSLINWCPKDKTVLANEQVIHGKCWRCQTETILKIVPQWFLKITSYAEKLLKDLKLLTKWPKQVIKMQKNWIGKTKGFEIILNLVNNKKKLKIYTQRIDILMGVTYISISPFHDLAKKELRKNEKNQFMKYMYTTNHHHFHMSKIKYIGKPTKQYAIHPITKEKIPIWITNYTALENNTTAKLSTPAHNKHDWNFAKKFNIKIKSVILLNKKNKNENIHQPIENLGILYNSLQFNGLKSKIGSKKIFEFLHEKKIIQKKNQYRLQDWGISRQRYWGTPIPVTYQKNKKIVLIPNSKLPVILPTISSMRDFKNISTIYKKWSKTKIKNINVRRETDTFDTFIESSWYYIRYTSPHYLKSMINIQSAKYWLPIDQYIGGIEHATMHLIYFRFFHKLLYDLKLVTTPEPAIKLLCQGMVLSDAFYYINQEGKKIWISPNEIKSIKNKKGEKKYIHKDKNKKIIHEGMIKMSKSKNNGVDPELMIQKYGSDTIRLFIMFSAPVQSDIEWNESGVKGMYRFLQKIWNLVYNYIHNINTTKKKKKINSIENIQSILNTTIKKVSQDINNRQSFNTAISEIMKFTNFVCNISFNENSNRKIIKNIIETIIKLIYPFTPHLSFILWKYLNNSTIIDYVKWPKYDEKCIIKNNFKYIIQINGKKKDIICIQNQNNQDEILYILKKKSKISKILETKKIKKIIFIKNKLINLVI